MLIGPLDAFNYDVYGITNAVRTTEEGCTCGICRVSCENGRFNDFFIPSDVLWRIVDARIMLIFSRLGILFIYAYNASAVVNYPLKLIYRARKNPRVEAVIHIESKGVAERWRIVLEYLWFMVVFL